MVKYLNFIQVQMANLVFQKAFFPILIDVIDTDALLCDWAEPGHVEALGDHAFQFEIASFDRFDFLNDFDFAWLGKQIQRASKSHKIYIKMPF